MLTRNVKSPYQPSVCSLTRDICPLFFSAKMQACQAETCRKEGSSGCPHGHTHQFPNAMIPIVSHTCSEAKQNRRRCTTRLAAAAAAWRLLVSFFFCFVMYENQNYRYTQRMQRGENDTASTFSLGSGRAIIKHEPGRMSLVEPAVLIREVCCALMLSVTSVEGTTYMYICICMYN